MPAFENLGENRGRMSVKRLLTCDLNDLMNGIIRFRGEYETETDTIQISCERIEIGAVGELLNRDNFGFRFQVQFTVPHAPMLEQIHKVSFFDNGELKEEVTLSREDILNIISGSDTGCFLPIMRLIESAQSNTKFLENCNHLKADFTKENFIKIFQTILNGHLFTEANALACLLAIIGLIIAFIGLITCAGLLGCGAAAAGYTLASANLALCFV